MSPASALAADALVRFGAPLHQARLVVVALHGRDQTPAYLDEHVVQPLALADVCWLAPVAPSRTWYPHSFLAARSQNQPALDASLERVEAVLGALTAEGVPASRQVLLGFSQGACLASELVWRRAPALRALVAFTGGVIGPPHMTLSEPRTLAGLPSLFATSDDDPFVPLWRVEQTARAFTEAGARVELVRQAGARHEIAPAHLQAARSLLSSTSRSEAA